MGYAIVGVNKINSVAGLNAASAHNQRQVNIPNADKNLEHLNEEVISAEGKTTWIYFRKK